MPNPYQTCMPAPGLCLCSPAFISTKNMTGSRQFSKSLPVFKNVSASLTQTIARTAYISGVCLRPSQQHIFTILFSQSCCSRFLSLVSTFLPTQYLLFVLHFSKCRRLGRYAFLIHNLNVQTKLPLIFQTCSPFTHCTDCKIAHHEKLLPR